MPRLFSDTEHLDFLTTKIAVETYMRETYGISQAALHCLAKLNASASVKKSGPIEGGVRFNGARANMVKLGLIVQDVKIEYRGPLKGHHYYWFRLTDRGKIMLALARKLGW